jgi:hypothetical protein
MMGKVYLLDRLLYEADREVEIGWAIRGNATPIGMIMSITGVQWKLGDKPGPRPIDAEVRLMEMSRV